MGARIKGAHTRAHRVRTVAGIYCSRRGRYSRAIIERAASQGRVAKLYAQLWPCVPGEDFVVAAYLAIRIAAATKAGRSPKDATRFAVALYHGMGETVRAVQMTLEEAERIHWAPVEAELLKRGRTDEVAYVKEVVK